MTLDGRVSILALGLSLGVLFNTAETTAKIRSNVIGHVSTSTYIKGGMHAHRKKKAKKKQVRKAKSSKARRKKWVRVKIKKHKKAPTQWAIIRKDRYKYATLLAIKAKQHGVPVRIAIAVGIQESGLNPRARGDHGKSYGLMQIKCTTARGIGYRDKCARLYDPVINAEWGMRYLALALKGPNGGVWRYNQGIYARRPVRMARKYQAKVNLHARNIHLASFGIVQ